MNETLAGLRREIDEIDNGLLRLFQRRMGVVARVAEYKRQNNLPVLDASREEQVIDRLCVQAEESYRDQIAALMRLVMALSKDQQRGEIEAGLKNLDTRLTKHD